MNIERNREIADALASVRAEIPQHVTLIVVTKTFPASDVEILYGLGERNFGENRDSEGAEKSALLPDDAQWHFQGGIQSNKLRSIVTWSDYIHSLDEVSHAEKISTLALEMNKKQNCFIQINLDSDQRNETRSGIERSELTRFVDQISQFSGINIVGVMGVGPLNRDPGPAFVELQSASHELQKVVPGATFISGGMSGDFHIALEYGATHVRIGSSILGSR
jgi:pyridoxal phosphate enzyme (YggS family)